MSGIPLSYFTGLGARTIKPGRADPAGCQKVWDAWDAHVKWRDSPNTADVIRERGTTLATYKALRAGKPCRDAPATPAGFVQLSLHMYRTYPQLQGARIRNGYKLYKGPGALFYIKDSAGRTVSKGLRATDSNSLFRGGRGAPASPAYTPRPVYPTFSIPGRDPRQSFMNPIEFPQGIQFGPTTPPTAIESIPTWAWVLGGVSLAAIVGGALLRSRS